MDFLLIEIVIAVFEICKHIYIIYMYKKILLVPQYRVYYRIKYNACHNRKYRCTTHQNTLTYKQATNAKYINANTGVYILHINIYFRKLRFISFQYCSKLAQINLAYCQVFCQTYHNQYVNIHSAQFMYYSVVHKLGTVYTLPEKLNQLRTLLV